MKKVVLITTMMSLLMTGCNQYASANVAFNDTKDHWAEAAINAAVKNGYVDGYEDGSFKPEQNVSRAEFIKLVVSAVKLSLPEAKDGEDWYTPYVTAAKEKNIYHTEDFTSGDLNTPISRLEMSLISLRATREDMQQEGVLMDNDSVMFNATKTGLIQGLSRGELGPDKPTTRAQSVTIIERILKLNKGDTLPVDKIALGNAEIALRGTNFETAYGLRQAVTLPIEHDLNKDIKMKIKEIIFFDSSDKESPYWDLLANSERQDNLDNSYYFAYKIEFTTESERDYNLRVKDNFKMVGWFSVTSDSSRRVSVIGSNLVGSREGYVIFALTKDSTEGAAYQREALRNSAYYLGQKRFPLFIKE
ncbi:S-layer homology domain-containing protein [Paenibacillus naphthalenovorans]|uniref:S-layer homology domain-containing protein n=1 Tax=Paenibacillus naphthalenovorans TaxID=162209 RepID=UPI00088817F0|nr:S-layer homology domain-containing protein [Paenibacillus naphthalenovorans]SDI97234.1 S-layer homology domain-containing protein [Paenibacillus naphthalenovorans]